MPFFAYIIPSYYPSSFAKKLKQKIGPLCKKIFVLSVKKKLDIIIFTYIILSILVSIQHHIRPYHDSTPIKCPSFQSL